MCSAKTKYINIVIPITMSNAQRVVMTEVYIIYSPYFVQFFVRSLQCCIVIRGITIHQLHRCIDLYSYDPTTLICARQVGLPDDIYRSNIVLKGNESIVSILGNNSLDLSTSDFIWMFFLSTFNDKGVKHYSIQSAYHA